MAQCTPAALEHRARACPEKEEKSGVFAPAGDAPGAGGRQRIHPPIPALSGEKISNLEPSARLSGPGVERGIPEEPPHEASRDQPRQHGKPGRSLLTGLRFGQAAPSFSLPSSAGGETSLADFKGKDVVLVFYCYDWGGI